VDVHSGGASVTFYNYIKGVQRLAKDYDEAGGEPTIVQALSLLADMLESGLAGDTAVSARHCGCDYSSQHICETHSRHLESWARP
jgi:hypothetical protein